MTLYLDEAQVRAALTMPALIGAMNRALAAFSAGEVVQPVRSVVKAEAGVLGTMPAYLQYLNSLGVKLVTVFEGNRERGLTTHMATILLFSAETGETLAVMDGRYITEARTAAVSAVSLRALADPHAKTVGILGSGVQAHSHVEALRAVMKGPRMRAWSPNRGRLEQFAAQAGVEAAESPQEAVVDADVVVLVNSSPVPIVEDAWVKPGAHVIAVGACMPSQREMDPALVARARLFVDSRAAALKESGDVILGGFENHIAGELGEVISGKVAGRANRGQTTVFKSLGLAVQDVAAARLVYDFYSPTTGLRSSPMP